MAQQIKLPKAELDQYIKLRNEDDQTNEAVSKLTSQLEQELLTRRMKYHTRKELMLFDKSTSVYKAVGKIYLLSTVDSFSAELRNDLGKSDIKILGLKQTGIALVAHQDTLKMQMNEIIRPYLKQ